MTYARWYWRSFWLVAIGLAAYVVALLTLLAMRHPAALSLGDGLAAAAVGLLLAILLAWLLVRWTIRPLAELSRHVRSATAGGEQPLSLSFQQDDVGLLTGAFDQLRRDLAGRLSEVESQSQRLESVLSNMAEGVLAAAPDTTILLANDAARLLLDIAIPHAVGRSLLEVTRARPVFEALERALVTPAPVEVEFESPGVPRRTLALRATRLRGEPSPGVLLVLHDRTELKRLENLRRELVANVSHELKTPLAAIKGYAETLRLGAVDDPDHNLLFLRRIEEQADRLHELILDMLQLARLESGQQSLEFVELSIADILRRSVEQHSRSAAGKQIAVSVQVASEDLTVFADEEALQTVINNLLDNALKYTPPGGQVQLRASSQTATVVLEVEDTGIGIAEAERKRIFERFYRVDKARSRELGGTGLGLAIVKHLVQAHGGTVGVNSELGKGATFRVELPRRAENPQPLPPRMRAAVSD